MSTNSTGQIAEKNFADQVVHQIIDCAFASTVHAATAYAFFPAITVSTAAIYGANASIIAGAIQWINLKTHFENMDLIITITELAFHIIAGAICTTAVGYPLTFSAAVALSGATILCGLVIVEFVKLIIGLKLNQQ